jgi:hypothetical protein
MSWTLPQLHLSTAALPPLSRSAGRAYWVDVAKALSLSLVVAWHVFPSEFLLNKIFLVLRMPLFLASQDFL